MYVIIIREWFILCFFCFKLKLQKEINHFVLFLSFENQNVQMLKSN